MRTLKNVLSKTEHRKGAAGHRQGAERCTSSSNGAPMNVGCTRSAPGRDPCGLLKGALRIQILNIYRASSGLRWICDHERRRNEIRKGPARSRNSTASRRVRRSYGARWICESPFSTFKKIYRWMRDLATPPPPTPHSGRKGIDGLSAGARPHTEQNG